MGRLAVKALANKNKNKTKKGLTMLKKIESTSEQLHNPCIKKKKSSVCLSLISVGSMRNDASVIGGNKLSVLHEGVKER